MDLATAYFGFFALVALACALGVLLLRHPLSAAVSLVGVMLALGGIYGLLAAPFLGVIQILVYAGAIMMLVVFVIMMLNCARDDGVPATDRLAVAGLVLPLALVVVVGGVLGRTELTADPGAVSGKIDNLASLLFDFGPHSGGLWLLFEVIGLVLLSALTGAVLLARPASSDEEEAA